VKVHLSQIFRVTILFFAITFPIPYKISKSKMNLHQHQFPYMMQQLQEDSFPMMVQPQQELPSDTPTKDVTVFISGRTFCIVQSLFEKVQGLAWYDVGGLPHLNAHPDLFEVILQFFLFGCLPSKAVIKQDKTPLLKMVSALRDAEELHACILHDGKIKKKARTQPSDFMRSNSSLKSGLSLRNSNKIESISASSSKKSGKSYFSSLSRMSRNSATDIPPIVKSVTFDSSDSLSTSGFVSHIASDTSTVSSGSSNKENPKKRQKLLQIWQKGPSSRKMTHADWCAFSEYIV
jgi:hypothetical protein